MTLTTAILTIILSSIVIFFSAKRFAKSSSAIGDYLNLPRDVKGATFDAVSSSMPELLVALFSIIFFQKFEVGIGTIAGSALFNLLIIPGICVFVAPVAFTVSRKVISRDALFYMASIFVLIVLLMYFKTWGLLIAIILLATYLVYVYEIIIHTRKHQEKNNHNNTKSKISKEVFPFIFNFIIIGIFTFFLTRSSIDLSTLLGVSPIIIAFTITAAATSIPDTIISIVNAKNGDVDDATSNVFGSNIFDILVGIGLPLLIYTIYQGSVIIEFANLEIVLGLLGSTILILYFFADTHTLNKKHGFTLLLMYLVFVSYTVYLAVV
ncbi:hypothetical protein CMI42_01115 [Candidatus Pacearchaeota archaeon]|nr:hypothetical protein [Candidatus Pacearchaeota archaeon]